MNKTLVFFNIPEHGYFPVVLLTAQNKAVNYLYLLHFDKIIYILKEDSVLFLRCT